MNNWLIYGTGGWAKGKLSDQVVVTATGVVVGATSETHRGTFFGGGIEYAVSSNLILGVEYLRIDLNDKFHCEVPGLGGCNAGESRTASAESDVVRARLSLKLGGDDRRSTSPMK